MNQAVHRYFVLNKPHNMVSQFLSPHSVRLLGDLGYTFPAGTHPIGRLDNDSEGLLLLTTDKRVTRLLFQSTIPHRRTYLVKVKRDVQEGSLERLRKGIAIRVQGGGFAMTAPCEAERVPEPAGLFRHAQETHDYGSYTWLRLTLTEGRFHQVRKMVASLGHRCIRLIRISIEDVSLDGLKPGEVRELEEGIFFRQLKIPHTCLVNPA